MARIATFNEWTDLFSDWRKEMGIEHPYVKNYNFEVKFGELETDEIEFGAFKGRKKWERISQIPDQRIRDALLNYIVFQGDTEFASVEQQRYLYETAPSEYDAASLARIMTEEMRHGWQMSYLLVTYFGDSGKLEAQKLLERRAFKQNRLLGSFNVDIENWLDLFTFTQFIDRDGKYQLGMLAHSAFAPLARSMRPMLKEESFHLGTGNNGLIRMVKAGKIPLNILQKYINKWVPTAYDLFGTDHSGSAHWGYVWGLKGRFDEAENSQPADLDALNEYARSLYMKESQMLLDRINKLVPEDQPKLFLPDEKFNRKIGQAANQSYDVYGNLMPAEKFADYMAANLPNAADKALLTDLTKESDWIAAREVSKAE
jgi:benzoyl-CoA 2,3-dioxygenase component B